MSRRQRYVNLLTSTLLAEHGQKQVEPAAAIDPSVSFEEGDLRVAGSGGDSACMQFTCLRRCANRSELAIGMEVWTSSKS
eukprot:1515141-Amphidinium_carterae.1